LKLSVAACALLLSGIADASEERHFVRLEHVPFMHVSDEDVFRCACPGAVDFCKRWEREWRQDAAPELRNQTARECVIDMMLAIEGRDD
jgi:hypothetical protein